MNTIMILRATKNRDRAPNLPRLQSLDRRISALTSRWVQTGDISTPLVCQWQAESGDKGEVSFAESTIELARCA